MQQAWKIVQCARNFPDSKSHALSDGVKTPNAFPTNYDAIDEKEIAMSDTTNTGSTFTPRLLVESSAKFHINAPTRYIDITDWLFNVDDAEYIGCTPQSPVTPLRRSDACS